MEEGLEFDSAHSKSQLLLGNSDWLAENVKGLNESIEDMMHLIEHENALLQDGSTAKQQELIGLVKEISHRHHLLSDRYKKLTGEFSSNFQTENGMNGSEKSNPLLLTPAIKIQMQEIEAQEADSGISDTTLNAGSENSSSLSSDTDSETYYQTPQGHSLSSSHAKIPKHKMADLSSEVSEAECAEYENLVSQIAKYELESNVSNLKLQLAEEEINKLRDQLRNNEAALFRMANLEAELESAKNKIKLHEAEAENENARSLMLQGQIVDLETKLEAEKKQVKNMKDRDLEIQKLKAELHDNAGSFALEKWQLESCVSKLQEDLSSYETRSKEFETKFESLYENNKANEAEKTDMERNQEALRKKLVDYTVHAEAELCKKNELIDSLTAERDEIQTTLHSLVGEVSVCKEQIRTLEQKKCNIQSENKQLVDESEYAKKLISELNLRIEELEKEVGVQRVVISERAEEKREAIRQLCLSIDHYRSKYEEFRGAYLMHRPRTALAR